MSLQQLKFKNNDADLLFKTIFWHWNWFLSSVAKDAGKDGNGLKLFFSSFNDMPEEIFQKIIIMITVVSVPW